MPIDANLLNRHVHATIRHSIAWLWAISSEGRVPSHIMEPLPGMCSNPDPHEAMATFEIREGSWSWALLAIAERRLGAGHNAADKAETKVIGPLPRIIQAVQRQGDLHDLGRGNGLGRAATILLGVIQANAAHRRFTTQEMWTPAALDPLSEQHWDDPSHRAHLAKLLVAVGAICIARKTALPLEAWRTDLIQARAYRDEIASVLEIMEGRTPQGEESLLGRAAQAVRESIGTPLTPRDLFRWQFTLLNLVSEGDAEYLAGDSLGVLAEAWRQVATDGRFALVAPRANAPLIIAACDDPSLRGMKRLAAVLLAALPGTGVRLDERGKAWLRDLALRPDPASPRANGP